jgi:glycosyltransferase involved in cell wall biosynthesis
VRIGWLVDRPVYIGGAELTQAEFRLAAPEGVELVDCPPGEVVACDRYVVNNVVSYSMEDMGPLSSHPVVKYQHDQWPEGQDDVRRFLLERARLIFCSPIHKERFRWPHRDDGVCIPPALNLDRFKVPSRQVNRQRKGAVAVAQWRNGSKGQQNIDEWSRRNNVLLDVYGPGQFVPYGPNIDYKGELQHADISRILWQYETFVHLPAVLEPFGRAVAEAHAAGCKLIVNNLVGARYWIEQEPHKLASAAEDFWRVVLDE